MLKLNFLKILPCSLLTLLPFYSEASLDMLSLSLSSDSITVELTDSVTGFVPGVAKNSLYFAAFDASDNPVDWVQKDSGITNLAEVEAKLITDVNALSGSANTVEIGGNTTVNLSFAEELQGKSGKGIETVLQFDQDTFDTSSVSKIKLYWGFNSNGTDTTLGALQDTVVIPEGSNLALLLGAGVFGYFIMKRRGNRANIQLSK